ncbi:hypothetical protein FO519_006300, partial [Halicephalobus sp. NKZ332]
ELFPRYNLYKDLYQWYQRYISQTKGKYLEAKKSEDGSVIFSKAEQLILDKIGRKKIEGLGVPELGLQDLSVSSPPNERNYDVGFSYPMREFSSLSTASDEFDEHRDLDSRTVDDFDSGGIDNLDSRTVDDFDSGGTDDLDSRTVDDFDSGGIGDINSMIVNNFDSCEIDDLDSRRPDDIGDFSQLEPEEWALPTKKSRSGQRKEMVLDTIQETVRRMDSYFDRLIGLLEKNNGTESTEIDDKIKEIRIKTEETKLKIEETRLRSEEARARREEAELKIKIATLEKLQP